MLSCTATSTQNADAPVVLSLRTLDLSTKKSHSSSSTSAGQIFGKNSGSCAFHLALSSAFDTVIKLIKPSIFLEVENQFQNSLAPHLDDPCVC